MPSMRRRQLPQDVPQSPENVSGATARHVHEKIAARAYELFERRGRSDGLALQDWLQAEQEFSTDQSA